MIDFIKTFDLFHGVEQTGREIFDLQAINRVHVRLKHLCRCNSTYHVSCLDYIALSNLAINIFCLVYILNFAVARR